MKKALFALIALLLATAMLTGCMGTPVVVNDCTCPSEGQTAPTEPTAPVSEGAVKTGLAVITTAADSTSATAEAAGAVKLDSTLVAVTVDDEGIITSCTIDSIPATVNVDATGTITSDLAAAVPTKNELGENYGMVAWGGAIAEWDAQVAALCSYAVGKTVDQLKNGAIDETGKAPEGSELASSATIYLGGFVSGIEAAVNNATHLGAEAGDELKLVTLNKLSSSTNATAEAAGCVQLDGDIAALTVKDGIITSCIIDSVQAKVNFDTTGTITSDLTAQIPTKNELGENYGMVAWGGAIAEWDAQVAALCSYAVGKTVDQLKNGAIDETGKAPEGSELASSATIYLGGFVSGIEAAVNNATHLGAEAGDELKLVTLNKLSSSTNATAEAAGCVQLDGDIAALTVKDGIITSCIIDSVQAKINFDTTGAITSDLTAQIPSKNQLGENYGMVAWGGAIAEWNVQAASFASYVTGKTADQVAGIAINEATKPADGSDLASSVTISIGGFQALIAKAFG